MWRICNYTQLKPIVNGCKRCQLPVEFNSNIRSKGSSCSRTSLTIIPSKNLNKNEAKKSDQAVKFKCISHSFDNHSNSNLSNKNSTRDLPLKRESDICARKTLSIKKNIEFALNKNLPTPEKPENFIKTDLFAERKTKIYLNRCIPYKRKSGKCVDRLEDPFQSTDEINSERFYDCEEVSTDYSDLFTESMSRKTDMKSYNLAQLTRPTESNSQFSNRTLSEQAERLKSCPSNVTGNTTKIQRCSNMHSDDFIVQHDGQAKDCEAKSNHQNIYMLSGTLRCTKCNAKVPKHYPIKPNDRYSKNAVPAHYELEFKNILGANVKRSSHTYSDLQSRIPPTNFCPGSDQRIKLNGGLISKFCQSLPYSVNTLRESLKNLNPTISSKRTGHLKDPVQEYNKKGNLPFIFNGMRVYDDIPKPNKSSIADHCPLHFKTLHKNHAIQSYCNNQSSSEHAQPELRKKLVESNADSLFFKVKKNSSDLWANQPSRKKPNATVNNLIKSGNKNDYKKPVQIANQCEMEQKVLMKRTNHIQTRNDIHNLSKILCSKAQPSTNLGCEENQISNFNCDPSSKNAKYMDPKKTTIGPLRKAQLTELHCHKSNSIRRLQKLPMMALSDNNSHTQQQKLSNGFDFYRFDEQQRIEPDIGYIKSEMSQIDNIINQCEILKKKYAAHLEDKFAEYLQRMFIRNNNVLHEAGSMLQRKCLDTIGIQKNQPLIAKQNNSEIVLKNQELLSNCKREELEKRYKTAKSNHKKMQKKLQATEKPQNNGEKSLNCSEASLLKQCLKTQREKKCLYESNGIGANCKCIEAADKCDATDLQNAHACEKKTEVTERIYAETQERVVEKPKQRLDKEKLRKNNKQKDKTTVKTVGDRINKDLLPPWHMLNDDLISSIFQVNNQDHPVDMRRLESECQLFDAQNKREITKSGGIFEALGIPYSTHMDSTIYLFELRNRLADSCQQLQSSTTPHEGNLEGDEVRQHVDQLLINQWTNKFGELPLQIRPGSNILLPLPHSKGSYFISESNKYTPLKWLDLRMGKEFEYDDSDS